MKLDKEWSEVCMKSKREREQPETQHYCDDAGGVLLE